MDRRHANKPCRKWKHYPAGNPQAGACAKTCYVIHKRPYIAHGLHYLMHARIDAMKSSPNIMHEHPCAMSTCLCATQIRSYMMCGRFPPMQDNPYLMNGCDFVMNLSLNMT